MGTAQGIKGVSAAPGSRQNQIALIDCVSFYASCERVFEPKLIGRPIVVLSNNDLRGGNR